MIFRSDQLADISKLWKFYPRKYKLRFVFLFILMIISSFAEMLSIGSLIPFLAILVSPDLLYSYKYLQPFMSYLENSDLQQVRLVTFLIFISCILIAGIIRYSLLFISTKVVFRAGVFLSESIFHKVLGIPFDEHINTNTSVHLNIIFNKTNDTVYGLLLPLTSIISSLFIVVSVLTVLIILDPVVMLSCFTLFGFSYLLIIFLTRKLVSANSHTIANHSTLAVQVLQEALHGIRDLILSNTRRQVVASYTSHIDRMRSAQAQNAIIAAGPKFIIETMGILVISSIAFFLTSDGNNSGSVIPILGALAVGAQRILPALQQIYINLTSVRAVEVSLREIVNTLYESLDEDSGELNTSVVHDKFITFQDDISLTSVSYRYKGSKTDAISNLDLTIRKGERVGIMGTTGSGKSSILDLLMGLLLPTSGTIKVDGKILTPQNIYLWRNKISHVSQAIYFLDASIVANIALGVPENKVDWVKVKSVCQIAEIAEDIGNLPQGYLSPMGENGELFSGGQRQRIALARALYRGSEILLLDEATSALDVETESKVMQNLINYSSDTTIIMVAHRTAVLEFCNTLLKVKKGRIVEPSH